MKGVALTDHGNMFGAYELNKQCKKKGMKPLFANEMYFASGSATTKEKVEGEKPYYHLIVFAMNDEGYKNLMRLTSWSWIEGKYYKPRIDMTRLAQWNEGLIVTCACLGGLPSQYFLNGRVEEAEDHILEMKKLLGDRYYIELTHTNVIDDGKPLQTMANGFLIKMAQKHNIEMIITADAHYVEKDEWDFHKTLIGINTGRVGKVTKDSDQDDGGLYYQKEQYYIKSYEDIIEHYNTYHGPEMEPLVRQALENTNKIADRCNVDFKEGMKIIPQIVDEPDKVMAEECYEYLDKYLLSIGIYVKDDRGAVACVDRDKEKEYRLRLRHELDVITKMEFADYFHVVSEYTQWAKDNGIMVGGGRGSAAGSLVAFCMRITSIDPIKYDLLFERFLNRGRAKRPEIEFPGYTIQQYEEDKVNA